MNQLFPGLLCRPAEYEGGIRVSFAMATDAVKLDWRGETLGQWQLSDVTVKRVTGTVFEITLSGDMWTFVPDNPPSFAFTALPEVSDDALRSAVAGWIDRVTRGVDLPRLGTAAIGATVVALAMTVGILMGRYRVDDSTLALSLLIIAAAAIGGALTHALKPARVDSVQSVRDQPGVLAVRAGTPPLSVRDVMHALAQAAGRDPASQIVQSASVDLETADSLRRVPEAEPEGSAIDSEVETSKVLGETTDGAATRSEIDGGYLAAGAEGSPSDLVASSAGPEDQDLEAAASGAIPVDPADSAASQRPALERWVRLDVITSERAGVGPEPWIDLDESIDDLTLIRGIGPATSAALIDLGIVSLEILASLDSDDQERLRAELGRFGQRLRSDDWVGQARAIVSQRSTGDR